MHLRRTALTLPLSAALLLAACGGGTDPTGAPGAGEADAVSGERLAVVATTTHLQEFSRIVGGDLVEVTGVMERGVDAHDYAPTPADVIALGEARLLVENGAGLEEWLEGLIESSGFDGTRVDASEGVELRDAGDHGHDHGGADAHGGDDHAHGEDGHGHGDEAHGDEAHGDEAHGDEPGAAGAGAEQTATGDDHGHEGADPHIWQSPVNAVAMVETIADAFAEADPDNAGTYGGNAATYAEELRALDAEIEQELAGLTERRFVSQHDAFGYYLDRYDLEFVGAVIPSFDSQAELSGAELAALVERIRETGAPAVFSEVALPPQTAETVAREAGVTVVAGEDSLYADSLGPEGSEAETYVGTMRHNTRVIADALGS